MEAIVNLYQSSWCHIAGGNNLQRECHDSLPEVHSYQIADETGTVSSQSGSVQRSQDSWKTDGRILSDVMKCLGEVLQQTEHRLEDTRPLLFGTLTSFVELLCAASKSI
jgi:hypothetical protein